MRYRLRELLVLTLVVCIVQQSCVIALAETTDSKNINMVQKEFKGADTNRSYSIEEQLEELYTNVSSSVGIKKEYVKIVHMLSGGKSVYAERYPNIYVDRLMKGEEVPFQLKGQTVEMKHIMQGQASRAVEIKRPSKEYLPDLAYNSMLQIKSEMDIRINADRGNMQVYFDVLLPDVKTNIVFYEALMKYMGYSEEQIGLFYRTYEKMVYKKEKNEKVVANTSEQWWVKDKFKAIFSGSGIGNIDNLAIAMSFDQLLMECDSPDTMKTEIPIPFKTEYTSRENMMAAALSLIGRVRYVWGGGHGGPSNVSGINPIWEVFSDLYTVNGKDNTCIKPGSTWCPIHGELGETNNACAFSDEGISSIWEYMEKRGDYLKQSTKYSKIENKDLTKIFKSGSLGYIRSNGDYTSVPIHRVEGLDCSGFASWLYNQIDSTRVYDANARNFVSASNLTELDFGTPLLPGDVIAWDAHICVVVGALDNTNRVYLQVEATPNVLKLGVAYYPDATSEQVRYAKRMAKEANKLIGDVKDDFVGSYSLKALQFNTRLVTSDNETGIEVIQYKNLSLGRLSNDYIDENEIVPGFGRTIKEMYASEIIQHTINSFSRTYIEGADEHETEIFKYDK